MAKEIEPTWLQALFLWQEYMDEDRTFYSVIEKDISEYDKEYLEFRDE